MVGSLLAEAELMVLMDHQVVAQQVLEEELMGLRLLKVVVILRKQILVELQAVRLIILLRMKLELEVLV